MSGGIYNNYRMSYNLFTQLEGYALNLEKTDEENLVTAIFVYLLNSSKSKHLQKKFLSHLLADQKKSLKKELIRQFKNKPTIKSQVRSGDSVFDIEISAKVSDDKIIIENKVGSNPNTNQIEKYLKATRGYVALLTPSNVNSPKVRRNLRYLGHFYWQDVYTIIKNVSKKCRSQIMKEFLLYMEDKNMAPFKFTKDELKNASAGYDFIAKADEFLEEVERRVGPDLRKTFRKKN